MRADMAESGPAFSAQCPSTTLSPSVFLCAALQHAGPQTPKASGPQMLHGLRYDVSNALEKLQEGHCDGKRWSGPKAITSKPTQAVAWLHLHVPTPAAFSAPVPS